MATEKRIEFDINDEKSAKIAEVISSKTCKKIIGLLAEKELSENDIAKELDMPINTVEYNLKKLISAGLAEKTQSFFWSVKGKKIPTYKIANKKIIISPKTSFKGVIASILAGGVVFGGLKMIMNYNNMPDLTRIAASASDKAGVLWEAAPENAGIAAAYASNISIFSNIAVWIAAGLILGLIAYFILKKVKLKGGLKK